MADKKCEAFFVKHFLSVFQILFLLKRYLHNKNLINLMETNPTLYLFFIFCLYLFFIFSLSFLAEKIQTKDKEKIQTKDKEKIQTKYKG